MFCRLKNRQLDELIVNVLKAMLCHGALQWISENTLGKSNSAWTLLQG